MKISTVSPLPTEDQEQELFVNYLRLKGYHFFRVPNETYTKSWSQKNKNKRLGVSQGVPDLFIVAGGSLCAVEMKRKKGGVVSPAQDRWLTILGNNGIQAVVCRGADEAINFIKERELWSL